MKKILTVLLAIIMVMGVFTAVNATTSSELANEIYKVGKPYGMSEANRVKIERYLSENPVKDSEADQILAKAKEVAKVFADAGVKKYSELSDSQKEKVKSIAVEAGKIIDLTVKFGTKAVEIYKNGKLIETVYYDGDKLLYTGNNVTPIIVVSSVVVIALVAGFALRKKFANA